MKKAFLSICMLLAMTASTASVSQLVSIPLKVCVIDPTDIEHPRPRTPVKTSTVMQEGHTLFFDASCAGSTLQLLQDGVLVFDGEVPESLEVSLPSTLSGDYTLQIIRGGFCFYGYISL